VLGSTDLDLAKNYRENAKWLRTQAAVVSFPDMREQLEKIASRYDAMAEAIERYFRSDPPG